MAQAGCSGAVGFAAKGRARGASSSRGAPSSGSSGTAAGASSVVASGEPPQPLARRPYCPSRYEDVAPAPAAAGGSRSARSAPSTAAPPASAVAVSTSAFGDVAAADVGDRVAQLRSRMRSLQELREQSAGMAQGQAPAPTLEQQLAAAPAPPQVAPWAPDVPPVAAAWEPPQPHQDSGSPGTCAAVAASFPPSRSPPPSLSRQPTPARAAAPGPAQDRLSSILSFLDEVEVSSRADICTLATRGGAGDTDATGGEPGAARFPPSGLAQDAAALHSRLSLLEVEVRDKRKIIDALKAALTESREREQQVAQEAAKEWDDKLQKQKAHYEAGMERHLRLVDRLLNEKTELTKRCELLQEEMKAVERRFQMKIEEMDEQASKELARSKQNWMAAEKLRREAWEKDKVREIKEITVKGLQPEVERILAERKQERLRMDERHREAMDNLKRELQEQAQAQVRETREHMLRQQEQALDQERDSHRRKLREEFERYSAQLQEERAKCASDLLAERRRREDLVRECAEGADGRLREALAAERSRTEASLREAQCAMSQAEERHRNEMSNLMERHRLELQRCEREQADQARADLERREAALRAELAAERDRQLDILTERLSREQVEKQRSLKEETQALIERVRTEAGEETRRLSALLETVREKAAAEASAAEGRRAALELSVKNFEDRHCADQARIAELEARVQTLEEEVRTARQQAEKALEEHRDELWKVSEMREKELAEAKEELERVQSRAAEDRAAAEASLKEAKGREEQIIADLEARVKRALHTKDETITELRTRCAASENKVREFEYLLARQREELLSGITQGGRRL